MVQVEVQDLTDTLLQSSPSAVMYCTILEMLRLLSSEQCSSYLKTKSETKSEGAARQLTWQRLSSCTFILVTSSLTSRRFTDLPAKTGRMGITMDRDDHHITERQAPFTLFFLLRSTVWGSVLPNNSSSIFAASHLCSLRVIHLRRYLSEVLTSVGLICLEITHMYLCDAK